MKTKAKAKAAAKRGETAIKTIKQFREKVDAALETMKTRDEAKACYDFSRDEYAEAEKSITAFALENPDQVFPSGHEGDDGEGETEMTRYTLRSGRTLERIDGGKLSDQNWLKSLPKKYIRVKFELNKAKLKADGLDAEALANLGLVRVETMSLKLKAKAA